MRLGVLGSGAREHALQWRLAQSPLAEKVYALPGNGGTDPNIAIDVFDFVAIAKACEDHAIDLLVVGPEGPLAAGIVDAFADHPTHILGPCQSAARLESSKIWSKAFMRRHAIPTADYAVVDRLQNFETFASEHGHRAVLKADGLASGKGVAVCRDASALAPEWERITTLRPEGERFLAEELIDGWELSIHILTDGSSWCPLPSSQDHKPLLDGDLGPNTGGMGAFSPVRACTDTLLRQISKDIIQPTLDGLAHESIPYCGFLYFGLIITEKGPVVIEYNVRLGDPETQALLPALTSDLVPALLDCVQEELTPNAITIGNQHIVDIVLASPGYPSAPVVGQPIDGLSAASESALVFHGGTQKQDDVFLTSGGRVLSVVGQGNSLKEALDRAYTGCRHIRFPGMQMRTDIGQRTQS
jgi:phosphoribosylamine---glycine ligase